MDSGKVWDVAVVGGGLAGAAAARAAVLAGARTVLLERDALPRSKICGEYLCPGAVEELRLLGLSSALEVSRTAPLLGMRLFAPSGCEIRTHFPEGQPGLSVHRCELDPLLVEGSGARVRRGATVTRVEQHANSVTLELAGGESIEASVVIGADGRNGIVARQADLRVPTESRRAVLHAYFRGVADAGPFGEMHLPGNGSYFGLNPGPDGCVNMTFVDDLERLGAGIATSAERVLREAIDGCDSLRERFASAETVGDVRVLAPLEVRTRSVVAGRILLAGDAAGFLDPLTGEGMYGAIVSGRMAGEAAAKGSAGRREYALSRRRALGSKDSLNRSFQWMLRHPSILEFVGRRLHENSDLGDALIRVIGNVARPTSLLRPRHLLGMIGWRAA